MPLYCECACYKSPVIFLPYANNFGNHSLFVAVGRGWGILGLTWFSGEREGGPIIQNLRENLGKFSWLGSFKPFSGERL